jgi:pyruvate/2-oxoglutarate dehydrogenase complex dihydrolipoamide dehydrogenase (E3) component
MVERKYVGGSCPNIACLPSKNIIHSAKVDSLYRGDQNDHNSGCCLDEVHAATLAISPIKPR